MSTEQAEFKKAALDIDAQLAFLSWSLNSEHKPMTEAEVSGLRCAIEKVRNEFGPILDHLLDA
jgi:hypothetical protein